MFVIIFRSASTNFFPGLSFRGVELPSSDDDDDVENSVDKDTALLLFDKCFKWITLIDGPFAFLILFILCWGTISPWSLVIIKRQKKVILEIFQRCCMLSVCACVLVCLCFAISGPTS